MHIHCAKNKATFTAVNIGIGIGHRNFFNLNIGTSVSNILHELPNSNEGLFYFRQVHCIHLYVYSCCVMQSADGLPA